ncbi:hypothetical protein E4U58_002103 [Claviceps cyperi]|nr:hypothetical protein E4U58_002103 [Claviceps cyperi]
MAALAWRGVRGPATRGTGSRLARSDMLEEVRSKELEADRAARVMNDLKLDESSDRPAKETQRSY